MAKLLSEKTTAKKIEALREEIASQVNRKAHDYEVLKGAHYLDTYIRVISQELT
jgi:hypothetical protein